MDDIQAYRAKKKLKKMLSNKSWNLEGFHAKSDLVVNAYLYDPFDTGEVALAGFTEQDISRLKQIKEPIEAVCGAVDQQFKRYVMAAGAQIRKRIEELGILMCIYMLNTASYQTLCAKEKTGHRHFIILLYRNRHTNVCTLRPFSLVSQEAILDVEMIKQYAQSVIARDEVANPSYFNASPVVPIRR
ncbi:hypothetical protein [Microbulbifer sp. THAF38]|uniref:hypothetical protein n=1 Tax=Microbulbifer sp. THAF38 TaxID=2587856 RepID=UPI00126914C3|nr:hypothetical protein [Microbulbifer sp. THAF38]